MKELQQHIVLYAKGRYVHDHVTVDLQRLCACFMEWFNPAVMGYNPRELYAIVLELWMDVVPVEKQRLFWETLFKTEKVISMAGTIEKLVVQIGVVDIPCFNAEPNPDFLRVQK